MHLSKWLRGAAAAVVASVALTAGTAASASAAPLPAWPDLLQGTFGYSWASDPTGVIATHSVGSDGSFSTSDHVWAPTLYPGGDACFEMSTVHYSDGTIRLMPYDWCGENGGWRTGWVVDTAFRNTYVRNAKYTIRIERTDAAANAWTAYLLNRNTGQWDQLYSKAGVHNGDHSGGWDYFEVYTRYNPSTGAGDYCGRMAGRTFSTTGLRFKIDNAWTPGSNANMNTIGSDDPADYGCPGLTLTRPSADSWTVTNAGLG